MEMPIPNLITSLLTSFLGLGLGSIKSVSPVIAHSSFLVIIFILIKTEGIFTPPMIYLFRH